MHPHALLSVMHIHLCLCLCLCLCLLSYKPAPPPLLPLTCRQGCDRGAEGATGVAVLPRFYIFICLFRLQQCRCQQLQNTDIHFFLHHCAFVACFHCRPTLTTTTTTTTFRHASIWPKSLAQRLAATHLGCWRWEAPSTVVAVAEPAPEPPAGAPWPETAWLAP